MSHPSFRFQALVLRVGSSARRCSAVAVLYACLAWSASPARAAPPSASWPLVWSDEFEGTAIDSSKWSWGSLPWGGQHHNDEYASWITPEDSYLSNGSLILRCRQATGSEFGGYPYSEGFVHSNGKLNYTYGYVEIRARYPTGRGVWPAFWTLPQGWPPEFDIAEYFGSDNRMHMGLAYGTCCPATWNSSNIYEDFTDWHTYGLEWGPGYAIWYKDGVVRKGIYASYVPAVPMYIILNSGMRWDADGTTPFPNYYEVDYARLYAPPDAVVNDNTLGAGLNQFDYFGSWGYWGSEAWAFQNDNHWSGVSGNYYDVRFSGTAVDLFGAVAPNHGIAAVSVDGGPESLVDFYAPSRVDKAHVWTSPVLAPGTHTLRVRATGTSNASSSGASVPADRVDAWLSPPPGLPAPWQSQDIGAVAAAGSAWASGDLFAVTGSGADIWGTADELQLVSQSVSGDVQITARVLSLDDTDGWAKAGVMIRETPASSSPHAFMLVSRDNGAAFQRRTASGGTSSSTAGSAIAPPYWVRLSRVGNTFTAYESANGTSWSQVGSASISMAAGVAAGLAVTSHNDGALCTATFDNVTISGAAPDTTPPAPPTGLVAIGGDGFVDLDWNDNVEPDLASYTVRRSTTSGGPYGLLAAGVTASDFTDSSVTNGTTYHYVVTAVDTSGNESGNSSQASATPAAPGGWTVITYDDFESGWGSYSDGGSDCSRYTGGTHAHQGSAAADIQDNSGSSSSFFHSTTYDVSSYSQLRVTFWFKAVSMESNEDFFLEYDDGGGWVIVESWASGSEFSNNQFIQQTVFIDGAVYDLTTTARIRFRCDASSNSDDVYIDEVELAGE